MTTSDTKPSLTLPPERTPESVRLDWLERQVRALLDLGYGISMYPLRDGSPVPATKPDLGIIFADATNSNHISVLHGDGSKVDLESGSAAASTTVSGIVELATATETTTGTDATRAVTPDGLAGSDYGKRIVQVQLVEGATSVAVGDKQGNWTFRVPAEMNGWNLVGVAMHVETAGTTNNLDVQINNVTQAADMLSTKMRIETGETDTSTSAQPGTIDTSNDDVATGDKIRVDVDAVQTTAPKGLTVTLVFQLP